MMRKTLTRWSVALVLLTALNAAPALAASRIYVRIAPPIAVVETRSAPPHRNYVWRPGYHRWNRNRYEWVNGSWARPPYRRAIWVRGHWAHQHRGYYWIPGRWVRR